MSKQIMRSGTSIGANISEDYALNPKMIFTQKCILHTKRLLKLLTGLICFLKTDLQHDSIKKDNLELLKYCQR